MPKSNLDKALDFVIDAEGGWVNDKYDPGGETKYGISRRSYPNVDIANLTPDQARDIYVRDFWGPFNCDKMPFPVALGVFGLAVMSYDDAARIIQKSLESLGQPIVVDGVIGSKTVAAIKKADPAALFDEFMARRAVFHAANDPNRRFLLGWLRRLMKAHRLGIMEG